ncbi:MAG TPA: hypothetical protein VFV72_15485 [Candidatus Limnocylindrales bacterium]|nr:hypothetical protein [Candidatus Limnocylindrales bacterium]
MEDRTGQLSPIERPPAGSGRDGVAPPAGLGPPHLADSRALMILTTEHWSLLSQRSLAWTETFARASMFLATLSAATVALALVGSVMRDGFTLFALVILPVVLFIGLATAVRVAQDNTDDARTVQGMNRLRHAYIEMVPDLEPYFVTTKYDDMAGIMVTLGAPPAVATRVGTRSVAAILGGVLHGFVTTMGMIMVINCVLGGVIAALSAVALGASDVAALGLGVIGALILLVLQAAWGVNSFRAANAGMTVRFPTPPSG